MVSHERGEENRDNDYDKRDIYVEIWDTNIP